jgi:Cd2+/Zn2+-exporting ATPase
MKRSTYYIEKMDCPTEEGMIRARLEKVAGIDTLNFNLLSRELTVTHRLDDERTIITALDAIGMASVPRVAGGEEEAPARAWARRPVVSRGEQLALGASGLLALAAEGAAYATGAEASLPVGLLAFGSMALGGLETLKKGLRDLRHLRLSINLLMVVAVAGAVVIGQWAEAAMVTFLFGLAEAIEQLALDRGRRAIRNLIELAPDVAFVGRDGGFAEVPAASVKIGETIRIRPGERIALDGRVLSGASAVNQAPITGESIPVEKATGDSVFAGTINEHGSLDVEVTANKGGTTLARIVRAVQQAQAEKAPTQRFVDRFARVYTPAVFIVALLVAIVPPLVLGAEFYEWLYRALVLLVIACPCALVISTPVTVVSGLTAAARRGILVKGGAYLEEGRRVRVVALDKTGTLTRGRPAVTDVVPLGEHSADEVLRTAASLDAPSEHPVASAIVAAWSGAAATEPGSESSERRAAAARVRDVVPVEGFEAIPGRGVKGRLNGTLYYVGNHRLAEEVDVCGPHVEQVLDRLESEGKTVAVVMDEQRVLGVLGVADTLRETSIAAVHELHDMGVRTVMLTGDNQKTAEVIARQVGIDDPRGGLLPEDKLAAIGDLLASHGAVAMVGDGINDAPALAKASVGVAMGAAGSDTALETADVALMEDDLRKLPEYLLLARRTSTVLKQNIGLALGIKAVFFVLALTGTATLWMAVFADMGATLLVVFNGLRPRHAGPTPLPAPA